VASTIWAFKCVRVEIIGCEKMVIGLPEIDDIDLCEGCVYGKRSRNSFLVNNLEGFKLP